MLQLIIVIIMLTDIVLSTAFNLLEFPAIQTLQIKLQT